MCFDLDSEPPVPRIAGAAVSHEDLELEASDGASFAAFHATPDGPSGTGIVVLPDVRGLYRFYEELALRFAERSYAAVAQCGRPSSLPLVAFAAAGGGAIPGIALRVPEKGVIGGQRG